MAHSHVANMSHAMCAHQQHCLCSTVLTCIPPPTAVVMTGVDAVLEALQREHKTYEHVTYQPVAMAANEDSRQAYVALAWHFRNIGPVDGMPPTGK